MEVGVVLLNEGSGRSSDGGSGGLEEGERRKGRGSVGAGDFERQSIKRMREERTAATVSAAVVAVAATTAVSAESSAATTGALALPATGVEAPPEEAVSIPMLSVEIRTRMRSRSRSEMSLGWNELDRVRGEPIAREETELTGQSSSKGRQNRREGR